MTCPKCGLTINGHAAKCPRCLARIPAENQNISPAGSGPARQTPPTPQNPPPYQGGARQNTGPDISPPNAGSYQPQTGAGYQRQSQSVPSQNPFAPPPYPSPGLQGTLRPESPVYWVTQVFKKYADFSGRARRREYWWFALFQWAVSLVLTLTGGFSLWDVLVALVTGETYMLAYMGVWFTILIIFNLGIIIPSLAVGMRRLHDTNRSGAYLLFLLIPLVGVILLIVYLVQDSGPGDNQYGPNPKTAAPAFAP